MPQEHVVAVLAFQHKMVDKNQQVIDKTLDQEYKYGFSTNIDQTKFDPGLDEEVITKLSKIKNEPEWLLEWRLKAFKNWKKMSEPTWAKIEYEPIDYQAKLSQYNGYNISCHDEDDGFIEVDVFGGVSPYSYSWDNSFFNRSF